MCGVVARKSDDLDRNFESLEIIAHDLQISIFVIFGSQFTSIHPSIYLIKTKSISDGCKFVHFKQNNSMRIQLDGICARRKYFSFEYLFAFRMCFETRMFNVLWLSVLAEKTLGAFFWLRSQLIGRRVNMNLCET